MVAWPGSLPQQPLVDSVEVQPEDVRLLSEQEGPIETRARTTSAGDIAQMQFGFTDAQYAVFTSFWTTTLAHGALAFTITHPLTLATVSAVFLGPPDVDARVPDWTVVTVNLYLEP